MEQAKTQTRTPTAETARVREHYESFAPPYDAAIRCWEWLLFEGGRQWVCSQAAGDVLEIAVGTGRNLGLYPSDVRLTAVELSSSMLDVARRRARALGCEADLRVGDAQALEFGDASFDTVVSTLSLSTIPDPYRAVREAHRVLREGGRLLLLEHVRSPSPAVRAVQRLLDPLAVRFGADHLVREPLEYLSAEGFVIEHLERAKLGIVERVVARRPPIR